MSNTLGERLASDALQGRNSATSKLALRRIGIDTYRENVAYLHRDCAVYRAEPPDSVGALHRKIAGERLGREEVYFLTEAMAASGRKLDWHEQLVVDKHCIGGIPGNGIGPMLEARDVMRVLENDPSAPKDLRQKSLRLAGRLIECAPDVRGGDGFAIARDILDSGRALAKMNAIIAAQGQKHFDHNNPQLGALTFEVRATGSGVVTGIDNLQVARVARVAGAPKVIGAGLDLFRKLGDAVAIGDVLYRVHAGFQSDLDFARHACARSTGYTIGRAEEVPHVFVEF